MDQEGASMQPATAAVEVARAEETDGKESAAAQAVHEAAHAAAEVEAAAVTAAAAAEKDAEKIAEASGERAAKKYLDAKLTEIEGSANKQIAELKVWLEERMKQIEGKPAGERKEEKREEPAAAPAATPAEEKRESAPRERRRYHWI